MTHEESERLDRWLFFARIVKSRTLAQKLVLSGAVRIDSERTLRPDRRGAPGLVLTIALPPRPRVVRILSIGARRGPASEARLLYEDLAPSPPAGPGLAP